MITLAESKSGMADKVDLAVIDTFRRESSLLDMLKFDNAVSPGTGGSTLTYGYTMLKTPSTAAFRKLNQEYVSNEAKREKKTTELKIFGGEFSIDRVIANTSGSLNEVQFQLNEKVKAARNLFHYAVINGDATAHEDEFDGLDVLLTDASTEYKEAAHLDLSTSSAIDANYKWFLDCMDEFLSGLSDKPAALLANGKMIARIQGIARRCGYLTQSEDAFGRKISGYNGIPLLDMGMYYNGSSSVDVVPMYEETVSEVQYTGLTDIYAVCLDEAGFHAISPAGGKIITTHLPDFSSSGVIKKGDVEMVAGVALKDTRKAGVMRGIKIK